VIYASYWMLVIVSQSSMTGDILSLYTDGEFIEERCIKTAQKYENALSRLPRIQIYCADQETGKIHWIRK